MGALEDSPGLLPTNETPPPTHIVKVQISTSTISPEHAVLSGFMGMSKPERQSPSCGNFLLFSVLRIGADEVTEQIKASVAKPEELSSIQELV